MKCDICFWGSKEVNNLCNIKKRPRGLDTLPDLLLLLPDETKIGNGNIAEVIYFLKCQIF